MMSAAIATETTQGLLYKSVSSAPKIQYASFKAPKVNHLGFEVSKTLIWRDWIPGREYTKCVTLKNVKFKGETIRYNVPKTPIFSASYPKKVKISPGTSYSIPITFRPLDLVQYKDSLRISTKAGEFYIDLKGVLPAMKIDLPDLLDFGMGAVNAASKLNFDIKNIGEVVVVYSWEVDGPFTISPIDGLIQPGQSSMTTVFFKPPDGLVYECEALIKYGDFKSQAKKLYLRGVGKYPHIIVSLPGRVSSSITNLFEKEVCVDFGYIPVGDTREKWINLHNLSPVRAPFKVEYCDGEAKIDTFFFSPNSYGIIEPMTVMSIPLLYIPKVVNMSSIDYLKVQTMGDLGYSTIKCLGAATG